MSEATRARVPQGFTVANRPPLVLKGMTGPQAIFELEVSVRD